MAAPFTCTDLHAVVVTTEGSLSTLWVSLCFSTTLGSSGKWTGEGDRSYVADTAQEAGNEGSLGTTTGIVFVLASALRLLSFDDPIIKLDSLFSNKSSVFKLPAAPGNGGKLDRPSSKFGDGGFGGVGD